MDRRTQPDELVRTWTETQRQLWTNWLDAVQRSGGTQGTAAWGAALDVWQRSVQQTLDTQAAWTRAWADSLLSTPGAPQELRERVRQGQELLQRWTDTQKRLWDGWFAVARQSAATPGAGLADGGQQVMQAWQNTARQMMDAQAEWARGWTAWQAGQQRSG
ncbi:MAG: hypothetical protein M3Q65_09045 [Chloroflexota bacterium]|nr:hypothetical protein [Chloroflexota bacterium]